MRSVSYRSEIVLKSYRIGEKYLDWTDEDPSFETILEVVTLYWLTETFPTSIFPYRNVSYEAIIL